MKPPTLHIYPQGSHHDDVLIVGDRKALLCLRHTINYCLDAYATRIRGGVGNPSTGADVFTNDGEGYLVRVLCVTKVPDNLAVPYTEAYASERRKDAIWPYELFKPGDKP